MIGHERTIGNTTIRCDGFVVRATVRDKFGCTEDFISREGVLWFRPSGEVVSYDVRGELRDVYEGWRTVMAAEGVIL